MAYQALYRKYRPQTFDDFIDQENTKKILINSILNNKISHAYLFSGPRGIGKTSMAKIFAKAINCTNFKEKKDICNNCENCIDIQNQSVDIIEIDAASNNGVEQIRELKDKVSVVSNKLNYKVYIIDEVHMLTNSAFNALLKTLEEPPSHVVFILATTEFYEVPETIVSRCQCFSFNRISIESLISRLKYIVKNEKINIDDDVIEEIAYYSRGGLRDAISMLDKLCSFTSDKITVDIFKSINGMISQIEIEKFYNDILNKDSKNILEMIDKVNNQGYDFKFFVEREMFFVRDKIIQYYVDKIDIKNGVKFNIDLVNVLNDILIALKESLNPIVILQIHLLKFINSCNDIDCNEKKLVNQNNHLDNISQEIKKESVDQSNNSFQDNKSLSNISINEQVKKVRINNSLATADINLKKQFLQKWPSFSNFFMDSMYGKISQLLSDVVPEVVGDKYIILSAETTGLMNKIYSNLSLAESFLQKIFNKEILIVVVTKVEFNKIKEKYIEDKKKNIVYQIQEECGKLIDDKNNLVNRAINLFGNDFVEIE